MRVEAKLRPIRVDLDANRTYAEFGHHTGEVGAAAVDRTRRPGKLIGYARVSTTDQDLRVQREALRRAGVSVVFEEKASGTKRDGRTELQKVLTVLDENDALIVTRLDRLGRSLRDLANIANAIEQAGAHLKVLEQSVDTSSAAGRAFFGMLATFAAFETDVRRERQLEGIAVAKRQGVYEGGKPRLDRERVKELASNGLGPAAIARELSMARSSVYRLLEEIRRAAPKKPKPATSAGKRNATRNRGLTRQ
jgi:DNA invertase Pin-like site-specific DNA recombinase